MTGRPHKLREEHIAKAAEVAEAGGALPTIARAIGVPYGTFKHWFYRGRDGSGTELETAFWEAINKGQADSEYQALKKISDSVDTRDAQWWLTHHPTCRDTWSNAAATRREVARVLSEVCAVIESSGLSAEEQTRLLLALQARGLGAQQGEQGDG